MNKKTKKNVLNALQNDEALTTKELASVIEDVASEVPTDVGGDMNCSQCPLYMLCSTFED